MSEGSTSAVEEEWQSAADVPWTLLDIDDIVDAYRAVVCPILRDDGLTPDRDKPTYDWLREHDLRPMLYALRVYHERTFSEFWSEDLELPRNERRQDAGYDWATADTRTVDALESFLSSRRERKGLAESSIDTLRYRLNRYVRAYRAENGAEDLLTPIDPDCDVPAYEAVDACWTAFDRLHDDLDGGVTKRRIHLVVSNWYAHLVRRKRAAVNPADGLDDEFDWSASNGDDSDTPCLSSRHVRSLYRAAETHEERLLILALCAWGLRPSEVARLHAGQFVLDVPDGDVPYVEFRERKNGPGEVSLLYGLDELEDWFASTSDPRTMPTTHHGTTSPADRMMTAIHDSEDREGSLSSEDREESLDSEGQVESLDPENRTEYLFPSPHASRAHVSRWTVWNRFRSLVDRADLPDEIDGVAPAPKMGRRFWYDAYASSLDVVLQSLDEIAAEQGSSSADVVLRNYLSDSRARQLRREYMRERLAAAFA